MTTKSYTITGASPPTYTYNRNYTNGYTGWDAAHNDPTGTGWGTWVSIYYYKHNQQHYINRNLLPFDTSGDPIPASAIIKSAAIRFNNTYSLVAAGTPSICVVTSDNCHWPMVADDYGNLRSNTTILGSRLISELVGVASFSIPLNATGIALIVKNGTNLFGLRHSGDVSDIPPTWIYSAYDTVTSLDNLIYLDVEYDNVQIETLPATNITPTTATLNGRLVFNAGTSTQVRFNYGLTDSYGTNTDWQDMDTDLGNFHADIAGLDPGVEYHFRAQARQ
jgi:hypothetical protein